MKFMIPVLILLLTLVLIQCSEKPVDQFDCFLGKWQVDFGTETYYETWSKNSKGNYSGEAFMFSKGDTLNYETFEIVNQDSKMKMLVNFEDLAPVEFALEELGECEFKAVNPENDFPQIISYSAINGEMKAFITNGEADTIHFDFKPLK